MNEGNAKNGMNNVVLVGGVRESFVRIPGSPIISVTKEEGCDVWKRSNIADVFVERQSALD